jgi:hypothetical protein
VARIGPGPLTRSAAKELTEFTRLARANADAVARMQPRPERWVPVTITDADPETNTYTAREDAFGSDGTRYAKPNGRSWGPTAFAKIRGIGAGTDALTSYPAEAWVRHAVTTAEGDFWELDTACKCTGGDSGSGADEGPQYVQTLCCPGVLTPTRLKGTWVVTAGSCPDIDGDTFPIRYFGWPEVINPITHGIIYSGFYCSWGTPTWPGCSTPITVTPEQQWVFTINFSCYGQQTQMQTTGLHPTVSLQYLGGPAAADPDFCFVRLPPLVAGSPGTPAFPQTYYFSCNPFMQVIPGFTWKRPTTPTETDCCPGASISLVVTAE